MSQPRDEPILLAEDGFFGHTARYDIAAGADWIVVGDHAIVPSRFTAHMEVIGLPAVEMDITVSIDGQPHCTRLTVIAPEAGEITTALLRLPVRRLVRDAMADVYERVGVAHGGKLIPAPMTSADVERYRSTFEVRKAPSELASAHSDKVLREVADIYRAAPRAPTKAVGEQLPPPSGPCSRAHAGRLVMEARRRVDPLTGKPFLGRALVARAGEAPE